MNPKSTVLILADPWEKLDHPEDTTLHLARKAIEDFGLEMHWATPSSVRLTPKGLVVTPDFELAVEKGEVKNRTRKAEAIPLTAYHSIHWRKDPPIDIETYQLWTLIVSTEAAPLFINSASGLLLWNEKFSTQRFAEWSIPTTILHNLEDFETFWTENHSAKWIVKPVTEAASRGVHFVPSDAASAKSLVKKIQEAYGSWIILQEYDASIDVVGETRAVLFWGSIVGALNKKSKRANSIMNFDLPPQDQPTLALTALTPTQEKRTKIIAKELYDSGICIATVDFIGDRILEINVTSPGLIRWMDEKDPTLKLAQKYWENVTQKT